MTNKEEIYKRIDTLTRVLKMYNDRAEREPFNETMRFNVMIADKELNTLLTKASDTTH